MNEHLAEETMLGKGFAYFCEHALHQATKDGYSWYAFDWVRVVDNSDRIGKCACGDWFASEHGYHWHDSGRCHTKERCTP